MTQFNPTPPPMHYATEPKPPETNGLATGALICSLIICVPFVTPIIGAILGVIAIVMISQSKGRQRGMGLAVAGIVISCAVFVGDIWATKFVSSKIAGTFGTVFTMFTQPAHDLIKNVETENYAAAKSVLAPALAAKTTDEDLRRLRKRLSDSCGNLVKINWDLQGHAFNMGLPAPAGWNPNAPNVSTNSPPSADEEDFPIELVFDRVTYYGAVSLTESTTQNASVNFGLLFKLKKLAIVTEDGIIYFPEDAAPAEPPDEESTDDDSED
jgi:hypothetical protein